MSDYGYTGTPGGLNILHGMELTIESGDLVFRKNGEIELAVARGSWRDVWKEATE